MSVHFRGRARQHQEGAGIGHSCQEGLPRDEGEQSIQIAFLLLSNCI
jgi:hypothetical protein